MFARYKISHKRSALGTAGRSRHKVPPKAASSMSRSWGAATGIFSKRGLHSSIRQLLLQQHRRKKKSVQLPWSLCPKSQRTLPAQMSGRPVQTAGLHSLDSTAKAQETRATVFNHRDRAKSPGEAFQVLVPPGGLRTGKLCVSKKLL